MAPKLRRSLRSVKAALEEECTLEHTSKNIPVAPDTPLIGFSSPGPSTQALIDDILESNPFPLPELDLLDSQFDSTPSVRKIPEATEETEKGSPQQEETAEKSPEAEPVQKRRKKGKKPKQCLIKQCPICPLKLKFLRQHIIKVHQWSGKPLAYMLSVLSTNIVKGKVFECGDCLLRFTNPRRHRRYFPLHQLRVVTSENTHRYPRSILEYMKEKGVLSEKGSDVIAAFAAYRRDELKKPITAFGIEIITKFFGGTKSLRKPENVGYVLKGIRAEKNYTFTTMRKLCYDIKLFLSYVNANHTASYKFNKNRIIDGITLYLKENARAGQTESLQRKEMRFTLVPPMSILCETQDLVEKFIEDRGILDSPWRNLSLQEKFGLMLFQIHSRANCRVGTLTNYPMSQFVNYKAGQFIRSNLHKTGNIYTNFCYLTETEIEIMKELHFEHEQKFHTKAEVLFPGGEESITTIQSAVIRKLMAKLFNITAFRFNPNSCRKSWDTYYDKNKMNLDDNLKKFFESNTGHSSKTRKDHYTAPPTDAELKDLFAKQFEVRLKFRKERESEDFVSSVALPLEGLPQELLSEARQNTESDLPDQEMEANTSFLEVTSSASTVTLKNIPLQRTSTGSKLDDDGSPTTDENTDSENEMNTAPRNDSNEAGPSTEKIIRRPPNPKWLQYEKKMLKMPKKKHYLDNSIRKLCLIVAKKHHRLTKATVKELVQQLRLPSKDEETVLNKVLTKTRNLYAQLGL